LEKIFGIFSWIPFAKSLDKLLGGFFGFIEGVMVVGVVLFYAMQVLPDDTLRTMLESSFVADFLIATMSVLQVFFPEAARQAVESAVDSTAEVLPTPTN
ncbi:MAG: CvpA family protein, partial [Candidatus Uhrbacteria bacterium]|nr:CvpA family protein [Candidatus Uhrbacteria bacterium]